MRRLDTSRWKPAKNYPKHDRLLLKYCKRHGGTTFANAKLDGDPFRYPRQIDGIRADVTGITDSFVSRS